MNVIGHFFFKKCFDALKSSNLKFGCERRKNERLLVISIGGNYNILDLDTRFKWQLATASFSEFAMDYCTRISC